MLLGSMLKNLKKGMLIKKKYIKEGIHQRYLPWQKKNETYYTQKYDKTWNIKIWYKIDTDQNEHKQSFRTR